MNIESPSSVGQSTPSLEHMVFNDSRQEEQSATPIKKPVSNQLNLDTNTQIKFDETTGLLQNIVTNAMTDKVLRKLPSDEYLHLLSLLDEIVSGSIDKKI